MDEDLNNEVNVLWTPEWHRVLFDVIQAARNDVFLVSPWLKLSGADLIIRALKQNTAVPPPTLRMLTTLEFRDLFNRVSASDLEAYMLLLAHGFEIRAVRGLHAKIYICDCQHVIISSGNLTSKGLGHISSCNLEVALHIQRSSVAQDLERRLSGVWSRAAKFTTERCAELAEQVRTSFLSGFSAVETLRLDFGERNEKSRSSRANPSLHYPWWQQIPEADDPVPPTLGAEEMLAAIMSDAHLRSAMTALSGLSGNIPKSRPDSSARKTVRLQRTERSAEVSQVVVDAGPGKAADSASDPDRRLARRIRSLVRDSPATRAREMRVQLAKAAFAIDKWEEAPFFPKPIAELLKKLMEGTSPETKLALPLRYSYADVRQSLDALSASDKGRVVESILRAKQAGRSVAILHAKGFLPSLGLAAVDEVLAVEECARTAGAQDELQTVRSLDMAPESSILRWALLLRAIRAPESRIVVGGDVAAEASGNAAWQTAQLAKSLLKQFGLPPRKGKVIATLIRTHGWLRREILKHAESGATQVLSRFVRQAQQYWPFRVAMADTLYGKELRDWAARQNVLIESTCARFYECSGSMFPIDHCPLDAQSIRECFPDKPSDWILQLMVAIGKWALENPILARDPAAVAAAARELSETPFSSSECARSVVLRGSHQKFCCRSVPGLGRMLSKMAKLPSSEWASWARNRQRRSLLRIVLRFAEESKGMPVEVAEIVEFVNRAVQLSGASGLWEIGQAVQAVGLDVSEVSQAAKLALEAVRRAEHDYLTSPSEDSALLYTRALATAGLCSRAMCAVMSAIKRWPESSALQREKESLEREYKVRHRAK